MKTVFAIVLALVAATSHGQRAYELPRPTETTVTSGFVECADAVGCIVQRACGAPATPFESSDFVDLGDVLAQGETLETPKASDLSETCVVSVLRDDATADDARANIVGLRYVKLRRDSDAFYYAGVTETPVHRVHRTVPSVAWRPSWWNRTALDYLLERQGTTLGDVEHEACGHIDRTHPEWTDCVENELSTLVQLLMVGDTPLSRCFVELAEIYGCTDCAYPLGDLAAQVLGMVRGERTGGDNCGGGAANWLCDDSSYSRVPGGARAKTNECRALFQARFERHDVDNPWSDDE